MVGSSALQHKSCTCHQTSWQDSACSSKPFCTPSKPERKEPTRRLGLLMWATSTALHLRPRLAPLYSDLHSHQALCTALQHECGLSSCAALTMMQSLQPACQAFGFPWEAHYGGRPRAYGKQKGPKSQKLQLIRVSDKAGTHTTLQRQSKEALTPLRLEILQCLWAADAFDEGDSFGIGGWPTTKDTCIWFSEQFSMKQARTIWPSLHKDAQKYIACWEALAQLALLQAACSKLRSQCLSFTLPSGCDNTAAEAGANRLFTTSWPLSIFLQLIARWAYAHAVELQPSHIPGRKNVWAGELSRNSLHRFPQAPCRVRFDLKQLASARRHVTLHEPSCRGPAELQHAQSERDRQKACSDRCNHCTVILHGSGTTMLAHLGTTRTKEGRRLLLSALAERIQDGLL